MSCAAISRRCPDRAPATSRRNVCVLGRWRPHPDRGGPEPREGASDLGDRSERLHVERAVAASGQDGHLAARVEARRRRRDLRRRLRAPGRGAGEAPPARSVPGPRPHPPRRGGWNGSGRRPPPPPRPSASPRHRRASGRSPARPLPPPRPPPREEPREPPDRVGAASRSSPPRPRGAEARRAPEPSRAAYRPRWTTACRPPSGRSPGAGHDRDPEQPGDLGTDLSGLAVRRPGARENQVPTDRADPAHQRPGRGEHVGAGEHRVREQPDPVRADRARLPKGRAARWPAPWRRPERSRRAAASRARRAGPVGRTG